MNSRAWLFGLTIVSILILIGFQNCAPTQNFELSQTLPQEQLSSIDEPSQAPTPGATPTPLPTPNPTPGPTPTPVSTPTPLPTPTPMPTPLPLPVDNSTKGKYCLMPAPALPKVRTQVIDLYGKTLSGTVSINNLINSGDRLSDLNIYVEDLQMNRVPVSTALKLNGVPIKASNGVAISSNFALEHTTMIQLDNNLTEGVYQIGAAVSGLMSLEYRRSDLDPWTSLASVSSDVQNTRFVCGASLYLDRSDQVQLRVRQVHATNVDVSFGLYWRPVVGSLLPAYCGDVNSMYTGAGMPTQALRDILATGWSALTRENYTVVADGPNLVKNHSFESVPGPVVSGGLTFFSALPEWSGARRFEVWTNGTGGMNGSDGGKYLELDADDPSQEDAIWQYVPAVKDVSYRYMIDIGRRPDTLADVTNTVEMWVSWQKDDQFTLLSSDRGPNVAGQWSTMARVVKSRSDTNIMQVKIREPDSANDSVGSMVDNVIFREIRESRNICN